MKKQFKKDILDMICDVETLILFELPEDNIKKRINERIERLRREVSNETNKNKTKQPPTYCAGCSFKCQASDCDCKCHDRMRDYYAKRN